MGFAVKLRSHVDFNGRAALVEQSRKPLTKRMMVFSVEDGEINLIGRETIYRNGERVGWLTSGGYGYTLGHPVGMGYVRNPAGVTSEWLDSGNYELEVANRRVSARLHYRGLYDPGMTRVRS